MKIKKIKFKIISVLTIMVLAFGLFSCASKPELKALIVTGQNNHNWRGSSVVLKSILEKTDIFSVTMVTSPREGTDMSEFVVDFTPYDVVVLNYTGDQWPEVTKNNFLNYVETGGGVVVYHAADNAFPEWKEYNEIIGLGGWGDRDEQSGPYLYVKDNKVVRDSSAGPGGTHGPQHEYIVEAFQPEHPILKGLPAKWLHTQDELYSQLRGPANNIEILATAYADNEFYGTERDEPVLFTVTYGSGRIFHTVLGHTSDEDRFYPSLECAGFITTLQRGSEWAATGKVTQEVPDGLPDETASIRWRYLEHMDMAIISERIRAYEIGKSTNCFVALKDLVAENIDNESNMGEYNDLIIDILGSRSASKEGKKILLKEFSWMATAAYQQVYEKLSSDTDLQDEALFALERLGY